MSTGWTWDQVRNELDVPRLKALNAYWKKQPPVHLLVAAYLGYSPAEESGEVSPDKQALELMSMFPSNQG